MHQKCYKNAAKNAPKMPETPLKNTLKTASKNVPKMP